LATLKRLRTINPLKDKPRTIGRSEVTIDYKEVDKLLQAGCDGIAIAGIIGIHKDTFYDRVKRDKGVSYTDYSRAQRDIGDSKLLTAQYDKALAGSETMLIWLGKNRLKQRENPIDSTITEATIAKSNDIMEQLLKLQQQSAQASIEKVPNQ
jgi:hypothetical protein